MSVVRCLHFLYKIVQVREELLIAAFLFAYIFNGKILLADSLDCGFHRGVKFLFGIYVAEQSNDGVSDRAEYDDKDSYNGSDASCYCPERTHYRRHHFKTHQRIPDRCLTICLYTAD